MYLKKLEIYGFKSFAERMKFKFNSGVTAIVGPNGCGKSNVVDTIRWVLGEQNTRLLRGNKMEDVIFHGSEGRKPLGMAEASLTLSNVKNILPVDYDEVTVTRRFFRSGESNYFINKTLCRLKDINELFMDTGMNRNAYSLIEQGKVELILNHKPEDRRPLFEEAAGIIKYKSRKQEALRKLETTEQNLVRVNDIIGEVARQINALKRQVKKAERYKEKQKELKELELKLSLDKFQQLEKEKKLWKKKSSHLKDEIEKISSKVNQEESSEQKLKLELTDLEKEISEVQQGIYKIESEIEKTRGKISLYKERKEELKERKRRICAQGKNVEGRLAEIEKRIEEGEENLKDLSFKIKEEIAEEKELKEILDREEKEKKVKEKLKKDLEEKNKDLEKVYNAIYSQLHFLEEWTESYQGYYRGVREILLAHKTGRGEFMPVCGVVADLITTSPELEMAIEAILGMRIQHIVVDSAKEAKGWINYLKIGDKGRATFLPLDMIKARFVNFKREEIKGKTAVIGWAVDLVEFSPKYKEIMEYLLGDTIIVENLDLALELKIKNKLATLAGEIINPYGAITGGSFKKKRGFLKGKREIKELKEKLERLKVKKEELALSLGKLEKENKKIENNLAHIIDKMTKVKVNLVSLEEKGIREKEFLQHKRERKEELSNEKEREEKEIEGLENEREKLKILLRNEEVFLKQLSKKKADYTKNLNSLQSSRQRTFQELTQREGEVRMKRKSLFGVQSELHDLEMKEMEVKVQRDNLKKILQENYEVSLDLWDNDGYEGEIIEREEVVREIERLKENIERMGPVNLIALEEHKELERRFSFLSAQRNDLKGAKENLNEVISKVNWTIKKRFLETFFAIKKNFKEVFRQLFNGGQAELFLVDEDNPLETPIEIIARPPGKKSQNISLLSGGEKVLTAISLLFAIFMTKPSPFCILDEIDAALDEVNIERFCKLVQRFAQETQFVIITHNRRTIEIADVLYGITMEKAGISKLVSVKM